MLAWATQNWPRSRPRLWRISPPEFLSPLRPPRVDTSVSRWPHSTGSPVSMARGFLPLVPPPTLWYKRLSSGSLRAGGSESHTARIMRSGQTRVAAYSFAMAPSPPQARARTTPRTTGLAPRRQPPGAEHPTSGGCTGPAGDGPLRLPGGPATGKRRVPLPRPPPCGPAAGGSPARIRAQPNAGPGARARRDCRTGLSEVDNLSIRRSGWPSTSRWNLYTLRPLLPPHQRFDRFGGAGLDTLAGSAMWLMVEGKGFEPSTSAMRTRRSPN